MDVVQFFDFRAKEWRTGLTLSELGSSVVRMVTSVGTCCAHCNDVEVNDTERQHRVCVNHCQWFEAEGSTPIARKDDR